jgi:hypothetical protein
MSGHGGIRAGLAPLEIAGGGPPRGRTAPGLPRGRTWLLAVGAVSAAVAIASLSVGGLSSINLDSLLDHPLLFHVLLTLPTLLALACLALAVLPRTLLINLAVLAGLIAAAETVAWALTPASPATQDEPETLYARDAALGYVLTPSVVTRHSLAVGNPEAYRVAYEIDDHGRRRTPTTPGVRSSFLLFFGDSNTFGEGLGQTDTLPYHAGELAAGHRPYNYGVPGYGPQHMLELLNVRRLAEEVPEPEGDAVYFLIPAHIARVIGSSRVSTGWGRHFPYYRLGPDGRLLASGDFVHGRPLTTLLYHVWATSSLAAASGVELPPRYSEGDYRLTAKILAESGRRLAQQVRLRGFHVVLGQAYNPAQLEVLDRTRAALVREGIPVLDYSRLLDPHDRRYRLSDFDYHNSAAANRAMAAQLVSDLRIAR